MLTNVAKLEKSLTGCWRLPSLPDQDERVTLLPNGTLEWVVTPTSSQRTALAIATGERMTGTWSVKNRRPTPALDRIRKVMRDSSTTLPDSSLRLIPEPLQQFSQYDPATGQRLALPRPASAPMPARPAKVSHPPVLGWLVLKVTNFPQSLLNMSFMGTKVDAVDLSHYLKEIFADHGHAILAYDGEVLKLRLPKAGKVQTWERVSRFFPWTEGDA